MITIKPALQKGMAHFDVPHVGWPRRTHDALTEEIWYTEPIYHAALTGSYLP